MTPAARVQTAVELLDVIIRAARDNGPAADTVIAQEFRARRYAGSKDKRAIRDLVYRAIRAFGDIPASGRAALLGLNDPEIRAQFGSGGYGPAAIEPGEAVAEASGVSRWMQEAFLPFVDDAEQQAMLTRAPLDLRVNRLKASPEDVLPSVAGDAIPGLDSGIRLPESSDIQQSAAFQEGLVEIQDAGSQLIVTWCDAQPGMTVVDLCAGAGGKTLALAAAMANQGRLIACDTDRGRLGRLPARAERAGARVEMRLLNPKREGEALGDLIGSADLVLVDAPCSGSGTWRRNPELRWRLTPKRLEHLNALQAHVLDLAAPLVKPGGQLVYAVCSLFGCEGADQIAAFLDRHEDWDAELAPLPLGRKSGKGYALTPHHDGTDGFFVARLRRAC